MPADCPPVTWHERPTDAPDSWAADALQLARRRLVSLRCNHDIVEGLLDDIQGSALVLFCDRSFRRIDSAGVTAFSVSRG
jgi:hypothetical protein